MAKLREHWLEMLATCVTAVLLAFTCAIFIGYASGPSIDVQQASFVQHAAHTSASP
jgi:hypothetical protein